MFSGSSLNGHCYSILHITMKTLMEDLPLTVNAIATLPLAASRAFFIRVARSRPAAHVTAVVFRRCWPGLAGLALRTLLRCGDAPALPCRSCGAGTHLRYPVTTPYQYIADYSASSRGMACCR